MDNKRLMLFVLREDMDDKKISIVRDLKKPGRKICYICLSDTADSVREMLQNSGFDDRDFHFIDSMGRHYGGKYSRLYTYISSPGDLDGLRKKLSEMKGMFSTFVFDSISALLHYNDAMRILKMTNDLIGSGLLVYLLEYDSIVPQDEMKSFLADVGMFADEMMNYV
jgi:hypothetical protein